MDYRLDPVKCIKEGWQALMAYPGLAIGGTFLVLVMTAAGGFIPFLGALFQLIVGPILMMGYFYLTTRIAIDNSPQLEDIFGGFKDVGRALGAYWLWTVATIVGMLPTFIMFVLMVAKAMDLSAPTGSMAHNPYEAAFLVVAVLNVIVLAAVLMRWSLVFFVVADEPHLSVIDCFKRSSQITFGNRFALFFLYILVFLTLVGGLLMLFVGYVVAFPLGLLAMARAYYWLKSFHPAAVPSRPPMYAGYAPDSGTPPTPDPLPPSPTI